ncbi:MAG TPA: hypothetical protein VD788_04545 [Candidatus Polarisedimenticolaceae bacterium]|nr:hypothetical protein [Candidatus Polarisedimenticolaceae bacterium]
MIAEAKSVTVVEELESDPPGVGVTVGIDFNGERVELGSFVARLIRGTMSGLRR